MKSAFHVTHPLIPLGDVVSIRWEQATSEQLVTGEVSMLDRVSFDGEVFAGGRLETKMKQFIAHPGDLVVSKIRARQGSIGVVQPASGKVSVTIHYRVLQPNAERVDVIYAWLALRSSYCREQFLAATGGAMKGEIGEESLLALKLPLPPLAEQRAIVERWRSAQAQIAAASVRVEKLDANLNTVFLRELGLQTGKLAFTAKAFALGWEELERWSIGYIRQASQGLIPESGRHPVLRLREVISDLENGWSPKCFERPAHNDEWGVLKLGAVSFGAFNENENKGLPPNLQPVSALEVKPGDVLISRANVPRYVGACALVRTTRLRLMLCDKIFRVVFKQDSPIDGGYLAEVMKIPHLRRQIETAVTGSSPTMQNITKSALLGLHLPLPPLKVQRKLVERVTVARAEIARERAAAAQLRQTIAVEVESLILGTKPPPRS